MYGHREDPEFPRIRDPRTGATDGEVSTFADILGDRNAYISVGSDGVREHHGGWVTRIPTVHARPTVQLKRVVDS